MATARYELKFPISLAQKLKFVKDVCPGVVADANGVRATYRVSSMYFDTSDLRAYWQKMDGEAVRSIGWLWYRNGQKRSETNYKKKKIIEILDAQIAHINGESFKILPIIIIWRGMAKFFLGIDKF